MKAAAAIAALALAGCDWDLNRMMNQSRCEADEATALLPDGTCNQLPPDGTIPWRSAAADPGPGRIDRARLERGRDRFEIFCAPCHGLSGHAVTEVTENMTLRPPPSLHEPRLVRVADEHVVAVIRDGFGVMPAYGHAIAAEDRWAVAAWVRVLQLSQDAELAALPPAVREEALRWLP